jgi:hypothetical protein
VLFISDIRNCTSKEAEQKRIDKEMANIRIKFSKPQVRGCAAARARAPIGGRSSEPRPAAVQPRGARAGGELGARAHERVACPRLVRAAAAQPRPPAHALAPSPPARRAAAPRRPRWRARRSPPAVRSLGPERVPAQEVRVEDPLHVHARLRGRLWPHGERRTHQQPQGARASERASDAAARALAPVDDGAGERARTSRRRLLRRAAPHTAHTPTSARGQ